MADEDQEEIERRRKKKPKPLAAAEGPEAPPPPPGGAEGQMSSMSAQFEQLEKDYKDNKIDQQTYINKLKDIATELAKMEVTPGADKYIDKVHHAHQAYIAGKINALSAQPPQVLQYSTPPPDNLAANTGNVADQNSAASAGNDMQSPTVATTTTTSAHPSQRGRPTPQQVKHVMTASMLQHSLSEGLDQYNDLVRRGVIHTPQEKLQAANRLFRAREGAMHQEGVELTGTQEYQQWETLRTGLEAEVAALGPEVTSEAPAAENNLTGEKAAMVTLSAAAGMTAVPSPESSLEQLAQDGWKMLEQNNSSMTIENANGDRAILGNDGSVSSEFAKVAADVFQRLNPNTQADVSMSAPGVGENGTASALGQLYKDLEVFPAGNFGDISVNGKNAEKLREASSSSSAASESPSADSGPSFNPPH